MDQSYLGMGQRPLGDICPCHNNCANPQFLSCLRDLGETLVMLDPVESQDSQAPRYSFPWAGLR